jgi:hypothetical protein
LRRGKLLAATGVRGSAAVNISDALAPAGRAPATIVVDVTPANLKALVKRPKDYGDRVQPLLNIGVLVKYPTGKGGVILNQMNVPAKEASPINAEKKRRILKSLLKNLDAGKD